MRAPCWIAVSAAGLLAAACGGEDVRTLEPEETPVVEAPPIAGMYEVAGATVDKRTGHKRDIEGTLILAESGETYTATFQLTTTAPGRPGEGAAVKAEVIGKGAGTIEGRTLTGEAETQLVMATVPGVDPGFAFIPRMVSTRIVSTSVATIADDGSVQIEIDNAPAEGEGDYYPTRTTLRGHRVASGALEPVARTEE